MRYRRSKTPGASYFFTLVTYDRLPIFSSPESFDLLHEALRYTIDSRPFLLDAFVVMPDHIHYVWTLPDNDADYPTRIGMVKSYFSKRYRGLEGSGTLSRTAKGEKSIWQRRYWEHQIFDEIDFTKHVEYIHYNPVKHGRVKAPKDWQWSSFHEYVGKGIYDKHWGSFNEITFDAEIGSE